MLATLQHFANLYRRSTAGRRGVVKDYTLAYEKFLREAALDDGDEREIAERDLLQAERESDGHFLIDRHPRSGDKLRLRLAKDGGEAWLFGLTAIASPSSDRDNLTNFFEAASTAQIPEKWSHAWQGWCADLAIRSRQGSTILPFKRNDPSGNTILLQTLTGILNWQGESLIRYASTRLCGDSKKLEQLTPRLGVALQTVTGNASLEAFGIFQKPRSVTFHGPLVLRHGDRISDYSSSAPVTLFDNHFPAADVSAVTTAPLCLTVENEDTFHELARRNPGILLIQTSYPGSAVRRLLRLLPPELPLHHFGDSDPSGFDILRDLREKTARSIQPLLMRFRPLDGSTLLTPKDVRLLQSLLENDPFADLHEPLREILAAGKKGDFEQESIPIKEVLAALALLTTD